MTETILGSEPAIRLTAFLGVLAAMTLWEIAAPRRRRDIPRVIRWTNNIALVVIDTAILRLTFPILAVGLAVIAEDRGWGLFNTLEVPVWAAVLVSMLLLDIAIYLAMVRRIFRSENMVCVRLIETFGQSKTSPPSRSSVTSWTNC